MWRRRGNVLIRSISNEGSDEASLSTIKQYRKYAERREDYQNNSAESIEHDYESMRDASGAHK